MSDYIVRPASEQDLRFIVKTWLDSYRSSHSSGLLSLSPHIEKCPTCSEPLDYGYTAVMGRVVVRILNRPGTKAFVASNPREQPPNDLHGWIVVEEGANIPSYKPPRYKLEVKVSPDPLVHYCYVKKLYRELGVAKKLFAAAGVDPRQRFLYTCHTALSVAVEKAGKIPRAEWAPLSARFTKETSQIHDQEREQAALQQPRADADSRHGLRRNLQER